jgi:hypothetical protein
MSRVICVHGKRQDAEIFSQRVGWLEKKLGPGFYLVWAEAPFVLPQEPGQQVPMRSWVSEVNSCVPYIFADVEALIAVSLGGTYMAG